MVTLTIDGKIAQVPKGTTIMEAAKSVNIQIPHLCYLKEINEIAACRVCCVEVEGERAMVTACNNHVKEGMVVHTNSPRARTTRRTNVQLILSQHDCKCATCVRSGNCQLQNISNDLGILELPFETQLPRGLRSAWTKTFPLYRDFNKCIKCMRCIQVCDKIQTLSIWDLAGTGSRTTIDVSGNRVIKDSDCALCGQCITHCPVGGLRERDDTAKARMALADKEKITVVQVAPAVRTAWGEYFGLDREEATMERMAGALRRLGFDYIYDTNFSADLTIMEEGNELLHRLKSGALVRWPMFTSCCPGWVRFLKSQYPELTSQLSTAKSPQQMFGAVSKTWLAEKLNVAPEKICCVSIMPCVAKKSEAELPTMRGEYGPDVDIVLTTRELVRMMRADHLDPHFIEEEPLDDPMGVHTGAGVIFGATGGVMEAALRTVSYVLTGENPDPDAF
ncbi:MAG: [Fe-Fe] hydrogenase large subunit C-terminal domain-containing protein, partial [Anaerotignum sp.]